MSIRSVAFSLIGLWLLAAPASAIVVSFTQTYKSGFGTGGISQAFMTQTSFAPNGLPACNKGLSNHLNASIPAAGFAELGGTAPRSLVAVRPFQYGSAGPIGAFPAAARPGVAGINGAALYTSMPATSMNNGCLMATTPSYAQGLVNGRWQASFFSAPAQFQIGTTNTMQPIPRAFGLIPVLENHTLAAGNGPAAVTSGPRAATMTLPRKGGGIAMDAATASQQISFRAGANTFGGGWRASGGGFMTLVVVNPFTGGMSTGAWNSGPRFAGHSKGGVLFGTQTGMFFNTMLGMSQTITLRVWNGAYTTGTVTAMDNGGAFATRRSLMGTDMRSGPFSSMGSLHLVAPFTASFTPFLAGASNLYFSGSSELIFQFLPEPGSARALAAGALALLLLRAWVRSRR